MADKKISELPVASSITIDDISLLVGSDTDYVVASVMTTYFNLQENISDIKNHQETTNRVNEIRLKLLEGEVAVLQQQVEKIKENK